MVFDSFQFLVFFVLVYGVYLLLQGKLRWQNLFLLAASYFFYGFWSWKFLLLLIATQVTDYYISQALHRLDDPSRRKKLLWLSVITNMGTLGFFKYFNFFTENLQDALRLFNMPVSEVTLNIILPMGISFYTIQELTYIIDVYKRRVTPAKRFEDFALFVSYFPQLVAGPIERAERLMPQVQTERVIRRDDIMEGGWLIFWGLFKKVFIADRLALLVDGVFAHPDAASGPMIALGALAFTIQIYADFSGYSDMAVGLGRLMGFRLMYNFNLPFFATSPSDFWRRWHISLSQCLRDNLYIPMGGNRYGFSREAFALMATMLIGGLWHGAQWHFVLWGAYCGGLLVIERVLRKSPLGHYIIRPGHPGSVPARMLHIGVMFALTVLGFLIFRVETVGDIGTMLGNLPDNWSALLSMKDHFKELLICIWLLALYQFAHYTTDDRFILFRLPIPVRALVYFIMYLSITLGAPHDARTFIYFQF